MRPDISEFSYGFAVTDELVHSIPGITAAPVFPSLYQEGQVGGGYDVMLQYSSVPLFVQFKLSDYMTRSNAVEAKKGVFSPPLYRMHLRPSRHSQQHQCLINLDQAGELVYYAAPQFHEVNEMNDAFLAQEVVQRSVWIRPSAIGALPDNENHHVSFKMTGDAYFFSEPVQIQEKIDSESMINRVRDRIPLEKPDASDPLKSIVRAIGRIERAAKKSALLFSNEQLTGEADRPTHPIERLSRYARRVLDAQLYLVRRSG